MIVVCEQCQTRFQLDESRVPSSGVRVRCSRCRHAFFLEVAGSGEDADPNEGTRELSQPLSAPVAGADPDEESDWKFADEPNEPGGEDETAPEVGDLPAEALLEHSPQDLSADPQEPSPVLAAEGGPAAEVSPREEPVLAEASEGSAPRSLEDIGSPETWNFLEEQPQEKAAAETPELPPLEPPPAEAPPPRAEKPAAAASSDQQGPQKEESETVGGLPPARLEQLFQRSGWAATAVLVVLALHGILTSGGMADARVPERLQVAGLVAERIEGRFVENALGGRLYVVTGQLKNASDRSMAMGAPLRLSLLDGDGMQLPTAAAYVGWVLPENRLREDPPDELAADLEARARQWVLRALEPGETRRFAAVFPSLPREAQRFSFEVER